MISLAIVLSQVLEDDIDQRFEEGVEWIDPEKVSEPIQVCLTTACNHSKHHKDEDQWKEEANKDV